MPLQGGRHSAPVGGQLAFECFGVSVNGHQGAGVQRRQRCAGRAASGTSAARRAPAGSWWSADSTSGATAWTFSAGVPGLGRSRTEVLISGVAARARASARASASATAAAQSSASTGGSRRAAVSSGWCSTACCSLGFSVEGFRASRLFRRALRQSRGAVSDATAAPPRVRAAETAVVTAGAEGTGPRPENPGAGRLCGRGGGSAGVVRGGSWWLPLGAGCGRAGQTDQRQCFIPGTPAKEGHDRQRHQPPHPCEHQGGHHQKEQAKEHQERQAKRAEKGQVESKRR